MTKEEKRQYDRDYHARRSSEAKRRKVDLQRARVHRLRDRLRAYKEERGCSRCLENDPVCLDFHHEEESTKEIAVANAIKQGWAWERTLKELRSVTSYVRIVTGSYMQISWQRGGAVVSIAAS